MTKRILSILLSIIICIGTIPAGSLLSAQAADYAAQLRKAGFTEEYIKPLVELHNKYPNWSFQPLQTGLSLKTAVENERTPHSQQNIQKTNSNTSRGFYCRCDKCFVNGDYKITEGKSWVAASESAVKYYMNPLNFLDEKYIFQFESTAYNSAHNQNGVEAIIKGSWMANSHIKYYDRNEGKEIWYSPGTLYSQAIMDASKNSGLSAYYIASKIMQEVGGAKPTAGGASGTYSGYEGIYNYYNIGAYTGAKDGLKWASLSSSGYVTNCTCKVRQGPTTNSTHLTTLPSGTKVNYKGATAKQSDGYVWYSISVTYNGQTYNGYIRSDLINYNNSDKYNRPWTNPYLSIYNGAKWIANNYTQTQSTGYLQKFNVNPASQNRFEHEYMANVQGAASEAAIQYNAYKKANILSAPKTFLIPIYSGLSSESINLTNVTGTAAKNVTGVTADISWNAVKNATGYEIQLSSDSGKNWKKAEETTGTSVMLTGLSFSSSYQVRIRAYAKTGNSYFYSPGWSSAISFKTLTSAENKAKIEKVKNIVFKNVTETTADITFSPVRGANIYQIQYSADKNNWKTITSTIWTTRTLNGFSPASKYYFRVMAYAKCDNEYSIINNYSDIYNLYTAPKSVDLSKLPFKDLKGYESYSGYIAYTSVYNSYIIGTNPPEATLFSPDDSITRAMLVSILYRMAGSPYDAGNPHKTSPFTDIKNSSVYYYNAACWALDNGITNQKTFKPNDDVTREQTARFLFAYAEKTGKIDKGYKTVDLTNYPDLKNASSWAVDPLRWANYENMITGTQQGFINPKGPTKRIHASRILYGFGTVCGIGNFE